MSSPFNNQVNWRGVKSVIPTTLAYYTGDITNETVTLFTVPANKTFYVISTEARCNTDAAGNKTGFFVSNGSGSVEFYFAFSGSTPSSEVHVVHDFCVPIPIISGYSIIIISQSTTAEIYAQILGWLE